MRRLPFLRFAFIAVVVAALPFARAQSSSTKAKEPRPILGLQTWTCRNMNFDQVVEFAVKHGITHLEMIKAHLDPAAPKEESLRKKAILDQ